MHTSGWLGTNARRVDGDPALRLFGAVLGLLQPLTASAWQSYKHATALTTDRDDVVCWPLFPDCHAWRAHLSPNLVGALLFALGVAGVGSAIAFVRRRADVGLVALASGAALGAALYALDYRLRFNQVTMLGWTTLVFLLAGRGRSQALQALVALFYVWAGTLKLDREWLSGAALYAKPLLVPDALLPAALAYVVVLELGLVFGLFAARPWLRWAVYVQLLAFHASSWAVVGHYYPLLMLGLTAIYPLVWTVSPAETLTWRAAVERPEVRRPVALAALAFSLPELFGRLGFPGDPSLTGEGRLFGLHMFDARVECVGGARMVTETGARSRVSLVNANLDARTRCDPIVFLGYARQLCRNVAGRNATLRVDLELDARRGSDASMRPLVRAEDVCRTPIAYSPWRPNPWIVH